MPLCDRAHRHGTARGRIRRVTRARTRRCCVAQCGRRPDYRNAFQASRARAACGTLPLLDKQSGAGRDRACREGSRRTLPGQPAGDLWSGRLSCGAGRLASRRHAGSWPAGPELGVVSWKALAGYRDFGRGAVHDDVAARQGLPAHGVQAGGPPTLRHAALIFTSACEAAMTGLTSDLSSTGR